MRPEQPSPLYRKRERSPGEGFHIRYKLVVVGLFLAGLAVALAIPVFAATEQPAFCTTCHEMTPYYSAFNAGPHKGVGCTDCHVDRGVAARVGHKFVALKEVVAHFTTSPRFPGPKVDVPDSRCVACHPSLPARTAGGFDHSPHTKALRCEKCHPDVGHKVTSAALAAAGLLRPGTPISATGTAPASGAVQLAALPTTTSISAAAATSDPARTANHKQVECMRCHGTALAACGDCHTAPHAARGQCSVCHRADPAPRPFAFVHPDSTACETCHKTRHPDRGACTQCHKPGTTWTFTHPAKAARPDCGSCHTAPAAGHRYRKTCAGCHDPGTPFAKARFAHTPASGCSGCHARPAAHSARACSTCHRAGTTWRFAHPDLGGCGSCHTPPARHYGSACSGCHRAGVPFKSAKVNHSVITGGCRSCHAPPAGHAGRGPACQTCHRLKGTSWRYTHPASSGCASCHRPPSNHFGSACASCHKPGVAFASATFSHPATGEHSWRSWACSKCHPNGYSSHSCTGCHAAGGGGD
jgi:hypothetical protein